jgi:hypothetical protein
LKIEKDGETQKKTISVGQIGVRLPFAGQSLCLVMVKELGEKPMMLLTKIAVKPQEVWTSPDFETNGLRRGLYELYDYTVEFRRS